VSPTFAKASAGERESGVRVRGANPQTLDVSGSNF
jgi:hypothetical protein